ncbi:hypothetical protein SPF06_09060 [Sinomonas sp. JGH33]|uniref:Uncharacterized protein n=2 Tax=Sinomonas terricola TaxID=3110330 RepID=A0ABU5T5C5_9MICC|nr:hypothetical protein [Sinomonas sp. JGH33]
MALPIQGVSSRGDSIRSLLAESGLDGDADRLVPVLLELRALGAGAPPVPSAALAALLDADDAGSSASGNIVRLDPGGARGGGSPGSRRHRRGRRGGGLTALAVAACLSLAGGGVAAADQGFRHAAGDAAAFLVGTLTGARPDQHPSPLPGAPADMHATGHDQRPAVPPGQAVRDSDQGGQGAAPSTDHPAPQASAASRTLPPTVPGTAAASTAPPASRRP